MTHTTANVGTIEGGTAANVVAERCSVELEARSLDDDMAGRLVGEMVDALLGCGERRRVRRGDGRRAALSRLSAAAHRRAVRAAAAALRDARDRAVVRDHRGGSDANALIAAGLPGAQRGQRHRAQPPARRVASRSRRSRRCST